MAAEVFTEEWSHHCRERLNQRGRFREVAAHWTDPVVLALTAEPALGFPGDRAVYLDLKGGECREARLATAADRSQATFVLTARPTVWRDLLGGADPVQAVLQGRLRLERGNALALARFAAGAREMVAAAAAAGGTFPTLP